MRVKSAAVLALCAVSFGLAACNSPQTPAGGTTVTPTAPVTVTPTSASPGDAQAQGADRFYVLDDEFKDTKGALTYDVHVPQLGYRGKGGNFEAARGFNDCMVFRFNDFLTQYAKAQWIKDDSRNSEVEHIGEHVLSGLLWVSVYGGGAHPFTVESTCVVNVDNAESLTLKDVFTNENKGLEVLSAQAAKLLPTTRAGDGYTKAGITPTREHFQVWTATPQGMHVYFQQGQVGPEAAGPVDITVPWSALKSQLKPGMYEALSS
ncbi:RsiV family protein [Nocardia seriolae]|uniref:DUF3298 domain-containing protein n=1 Tax=Nocardia seriolae TaxID=37332 RepID=A0ABC9Z300_9NOCA|nr:RsiV family protein [Nocardia seriolae]APA98066.1 hypothetical protein NS506_04018 [Nocardia seriolae]OJF80034.1 hypothetical protein NS14008_13530 [Nocardia seriolae]QOW36027.1 DUF3298 domain-containing protein [Nocardia seriolae]QUN16477.1 DUF3298 domain-containing protein [Nocardia seriolae]WKY49970.1 RsiV family protein [Nocardia seriolae]